MSGRKLLDQLATLTGLPGESVNLELLKNRRKTRQGPRHSYPARCAGRSCRLFARRACGSQARILSQILLNLLLNRNRNFCVLSLRPS